MSTTETFSSGMASHVHQERAFSGALKMIITFTILCCFGLVVLRIIKGGIEDSEPPSIDSVLGGSVKPMN